MENAILQFPEITLGILPGIGGCVVPYRKWPRGAAIFHDMICFGKALTAKEAAEIGMVAELADKSVFSPVITASNASDEAMLRALGEWIKVPGEK